MIARVAAMARVELLLTLRRGESVLLTLAIPVALLLFLTAADVLPLPADVDQPIDFLAPGILALAVMSSAMVGPAIATGFERDHGVLRRLGTTPLGRPALLAAKAAAVLAVEVVQVTVLVGVAVALGWDPAGSAALAAGAALLATVGFVGLALLLAGTLPALTTLAVANGLYVVLLLLGDMVFPLDRLPAAVEGVARALPAAALADALQAALADGGAPARPWMVLGLWALAAPAVAARFFRWAPSGP